MASSDATEKVNKKQQIKLYNYFKSTSSCRVRIALNLKGIDYEYKAVNLLKGEQHTPEYLELNPMGYVPALVDDDITIADSFAIIMYLEEKYPQRPLLPNDLATKAVNFQAASIVSSGIHPLHNSSVLKYIGEKIGPDEKLPWVQTHIRKGFNALEKLLSNHAGKYATGDEVHLSLPALKILNLSHSEKLTISPDFSKIPKLEKLILKGCTELVEICESIILAEGLVLLDVKYCRKLTKLPRSIGNLISLEIFDISGCSGLREFPGGLTSLKLLKEFRADGVDMNALLSLAKGIRSWNSFPQFVETLSLVRCNLSNDFFPQDLSNFSSLKFLNLSENFFTSLPDCCQTLSKLEKLSLNHCPLLQSVTGLPRNLKNLLRVGHMNYAEQTNAKYLECIQCHNLVEVEGCFKRVSIRYVDRRIKRNLGLLELEKTLIDSDLYKDIKVTHEYGIFSTWVPGDELPGCFTYKEKDITGLTFIVPDNVEIQGLTVGFVYYGKSRKTCGWVSVTVYNQTKNLKWNYDVIARSHISVVWLIYFKLGTLLEAGDEISTSVLCKHKFSTSVGNYMLGLKEFGFNLVLYGDNDADEEVYDTDFDQDILTSEQNNVTRLSLANETFFQLSDFNIPGKFYLFGRENLVYSNTVGKSFVLLLHGRNMTEMSFVPRFGQGEDDTMIHADDSCYIEDDDTMIRADDICYIRIDINQNTARYGNSNIEGG